MTPRTSHILAALLACGLLAACSSLPQPLQGQFAPLQPQQAVQADSVGAQVRWGGRIVETRPGNDHTCFEIIATPLSASGRPLPGDATLGRFIACRNGFYDPQVFAVGRELTFTGRVRGSETGKVGDYVYQYPLLAADVVFLWPERSQVELVGYPYPDPFFHAPPLPGRWGWGWHSRWWW